jgi:hypothetical protein
MKFCITRFELNNNCKLIKTTINFISENINSSDKEKNKGKKNIDFLYISDDKSIFALNYNFDDENEDKKNNHNK